MASRGGESDYKLHPDPPLAYPSKSKSQGSSGLAQEEPEPPEPGGLTEDIEMEEVQQRERLLTSENKPNRLEGKPTSSSSPNSTSTEPTGAYHRRISSLTDPENIDDAYPSSDDETASVTLLKGRKRDRTSWFTTPPVHGKRGEKYKGTRISKIAVCIGIAGGITVLVSAIIGGGVMVLGRKPVAKSEGWYPTREFPPPSSPKELD